MMDITNPESIRETIFAIARDGARPHIQAGIVKRLRIIHDTLQKIGEPVIAGALEEEIAALEKL